MKILLSAYACRPHQGSECGVGWHWAKQLATKGYEVWVVTRTKNKSLIESYLAIDPIANLHFVYCDLSSWAKWWKPLPGGVYLYYVLWQLRAYLSVKDLAKQVKFDLVHHVTFVSVRQPSFMGLLNIPFIFVPVAGGENTPRQLRKSYPLKGWMQDLVRDVVNSGVRFDPLMALTFAKASKIFVTSKQTQALLPERYRCKSKIQLAIGIDAVAAAIPVLPNNLPTAGFKILFVGRLLYWKGLHFGIRALAQLYQDYPNVQLTIVGSGSEEKWLQELAKGLNINHLIEWIPWMNQAEVMQVYQQHDVFLYPSLHDSGGMVVLESLVNGLPVVCLNLGGPGQIVDNSCGRVVKTQNLSETEIVKSLKNILQQLAQSKELLTQLSQGASVRCSEYGWDKLVSNLYPQNLDTSLSPGKFMEKLM